MNSFWPEGLHINGRYSVQDIIELANRDWLKGSYGEMSLSVVNLGTTYRIVLHYKNQNYNLMNIKQRSSESIYPLMLTECTIYSGLELSCLIRDKLTNNDMKAKLTNIIISSKQIQQEKTNETI